MKNFFFPNGRCDISVMTKNKFFHCAFFGKILLKSVNLCFSCNIFCVCGLCMVFGLRGYSVNRLVISAVIEFFGGFLNKNFVV